MKKRLLDHFVKGPQELLVSIYLMNFRCVRILIYVHFCMYFYFRRFMNQYFLLIACLQLWSRITPVSPATTWGPLIIIFIVSASKEAWDDYNRYLSDKKANEREVWLVKDGIRRQVFSFLHQYLICFYFIKKSSWSIVSCKPFNEYCLPGLLSYCVQVTNLHHKFILHNGILIVFSVLEKKTTFMKSCFFKAVFPYPVIQLLVWSVSLPMLS